MDKMLHDRDPVLAAALIAHGKDWRPDLVPVLELPRDDAQRLPAISLRTLEHRIEWAEGNGQAVFSQRWIDEDRSRWLRDGRQQAGWRAEFHMSPLPETLANALVGRTLRDVIDAPGAEAWRITTSTVVPGVKTTLGLVRKISEDQ